MDSAAGLGNLPQRARDERMFMFRFAKERIMPSATLHGFLLSFSNPLNRWWRKRRDAIGDGGTQTAQQMDASPAPDRDAGVARPSDDGPLRRHRRLRR